jgi:chloramphenicol 3-O phosphotransferase
MACIILLNGTSSSGKSTIAKKMQKQSEIPFWHFASDQFVEIGMLPERKNDGGLFDWRVNRPKFFDGFQRCIQALADADNNLIVEHLLETKGWFDYLQANLSQHDMFFVGVHCPLDILRKREQQRGDRYIGEAEYHLKHVHSFSQYDYEIDSSAQSPEESAKIILARWQKRGKSKLFV